MQDGRIPIVQKTLIGGLQPDDDVLAQGRDTAQWIDGQNMVVSNTTGYLSGVSTKNTVTTPPPTFNGSQNRYTVGGGIFNYLAPIYQKTIATFENSDWPNETWTFSGTGTASLVNALTEGDQALSLACTAGQTATGTSTLPASLNLSSLTYTTLAIDTNWNNVSNFSSGYIRIGSDSSNYRQFNLSSPGSIDYFILKFNFSSPSSTTGTPNLSAIQYVQISLTAGGGGSITVVLDNLRLASFASTTIGTLTLTPNAGNIQQAFIIDKIVGTSSSMVTNVGDSLFIQSASDSINDTIPIISGILKAGFTNNVPGFDPTNFYFSQFQKTGTASQNILYYVNGKNGYFSYDPAASAGSRNSRIDSGDYKYICSHKNMIFLGGSSSAPNLVQPSGVNDPVTLTSANAVTIPDISGSYITGLISMDEYLAIVRSDGIWKLYGSNPDSATTDFQLINSNSKVGCIEMKSACRVGPYIYFFNGDEIFRFDGNDSVSVSGNLGQMLSGFNVKFCSIYYNKIRDLVVFNFAPSTVVDPVVTKTGYYQLCYCPTAKAWGKMGAFDDPVSVEFWGLNWGGANYTKQLVYQGGLQIYQVDPTSPTDISMPWFIKPQWNDSDRPDLMKDHDTLTLYLRDQSSRNLPAIRVDMYSDFDPDNSVQTFQAQNEIQTISPSVAPDAGTYKIVFSGQTTGTLNWNDSAATIQAALEALGNIGSGNISVSGTLATTVTLTFQGTLAATNVDQVTISNNALTNSSVAITLNINTSQDGNAYTPTNNSLQVLLNGVSGRAMTFKASGTCTSQKDKAVMFSGYSYTYSEIEDL